TPMTATRKTTTPAAASRPPAPPCRKPRTASTSDSNAPPKKAEKNQGFWMTALMAFIAAAPSAGERRAKAAMMQTEKMKNSPAFSAAARMERKVRMGKALAMVGSSGSRFVRITGELRKIAWRSAGHTRHHRPVIAAQKYEQSSYLQNVRNPRICQGQSKVLSERPMAEP